VLLELVQNADDAGATKAAFLLDMRQHGTASLLGPGMAAWQGPALLAYNNAIFSPGALVLPTSCFCVIMLAYVLLCGACCTLEMLEPFDMQACSK
jgi:hypothetical protein